MTNTRTEREQQPLYRTTTPTTPTTTPTTTSSSSKLFQEKEAPDWEARYHAEAIRELHMENFGRKMPPSIHRKVLQDLIDGTPYEYYAYAIGQAAMAPFPSWRYVEAVMGRLIRERVKPESLMGWL